MAKPTLKNARKVHQERKLGRYNERNYREALDRIEELETEVSAIRKVKSSRKSYTIKPRTKNNDSEAVAVACASDWHFGAEVRPSQVQNLNEFNMRIATARGKEFFERVVTLTDKERQNVTIHELVLFLGGDLIDGALHMDTIQANEISEPIRQLTVVQGVIEAGLAYLEPHFQKITVVCKDGNHGRITQRIHHASRQGNSIEWYMYYNLASRYPQFNWVLDEALHSYLPIYMGHPGGRTLRFHHGDTIGFGGVNGPYTYLNRRRFQWNSANISKGSTVIDVMGHLHMYRVNPIGFVLNGSLIGYNSFAISLGAEYEPPAQAYFLIDKKRGMTVNIPILFRQ